MKVCCSVVGQPLNGLCSFHTFNKTGERTEVKRINTFPQAPPRQRLSMGRQRSENLSLAILLEQMRLNWMTPVPAED